MNNEIRSISNKMHERGLSSDKQEFGSFYLLRFLGAKINFEPNQCIVSLESVPPMFNPQGTLHGGIITTIMDISMGHLIKNEQSAGTTLELKVNFMSAIKHEKIKCIGSFLNAISPTENNKYSSPLSINIWDTDFSNKTSPDGDNFIIPSSA